MSFLVSFKIGETVRNMDLYHEFKCGNMGGMRPSKKTNTLVIISDQTKHLYEDKWFGNVLHYTGTGKIGDQDINYIQNRILTESKHNNVDVHLFEVINPSEYIYRGQVDLVAEPYQGEQKGDDGIMRKVWIFPVRARHSVEINNDVIQSFLDQKEKQARKLSYAELEQLAKERQSKIVSQRTVTSTIIFRDPFISEYVKRAANGRCQLCN